MFDLKSVIRGKSLPFLLLLSALSATFLSGCGGNGNSSPVTRSFQETIASPAPTGVGTSISVTASGTNSVLGSFTGTLSHSFLPPAAGSAVATITGGRFTQTFLNGAGTLTGSYTGTATLINPRSVEANLSITITIEGGTGSLTGAKGNSTATGKQNADGTLSLTNSGTITLPGGALHAP